MESENFTSKKYMIIIGQLIFSFSHTLRLPYISDAINASYAILKHFYNRYTHVQYINLLQLFISVK